LLGASLAAFAACARDLEDGASAPLADAAPSPDAPLDAADASLEAAGPSCTPVDVPPGGGARFCDLPGADVTSLAVPPEFCVREFAATPILEARVLRFAPNGDLFVTAPSMPTIGGSTDGPGAILVLPDDDGDGRADAVLTYAGPSPRNNAPSCAALEADPANLACVHGLVFAGGYMYFTRSDEVRRFPYAAGARVAPLAPSELVATLGGASIPDVRWTHTLEARSGGSVYVSRGRLDTPECSAEQMARGAVFTLHVEGGAALPVTPSIMADGLRNPMYVRCSPTSCGDCYAAELSGDNWGGVGGREKLALLATKGESWGFPCCVARDIPAPGWPADACANVGRELVAIPLHDTPFGFDFERGVFPAPWTRGVFVALHGVRTSFGGTGIAWLATDPTSLRPTGASKMFIDGFGSPTSRATDVAFAPDGRMFLADDTSGRIYWVAPRTLQKPR
jgi:glucose/arabinose dehydrogenase